MIKDSHLLREMEDSAIKKDGRLPFSIAIHIFESLWNEGKKLGVLPPKEPLEGIDIDIKVAKILNSCLKRSSQK